MKHSWRILLVLSTLLLLTVGVASADTLSYNFSGPVSASFDLPVNPTVVVFDLGFAFEVLPANLKINGVLSNDFLVFYSADPVTGGGGGFGAFSCGSCVDLNLGGPQLYSGSEASPTMLSLGDVALINIDTGAPGGTISTPEPSSLALLSVGIFAMLALGLVFGVFRRNLSIAAS